MKTRQLSSTFLQLLILALTTMFTMLLFSQLLRSDSDNTQLKQLAIRTNSLFCGVIASSSHCPPGGMAASDTSRPASHTQSRPPSPFGDLKWQGGSAAQAAAFITTIKTLGMRHFERHSRYLPKETEQLIAPVFRDYPALVSASACTYCGDLSQAILTLLKQQELNHEWVMEVGRGIPRYLPLLAERHALEPGELQRLTRIQALLGSAGSAQVAATVAEQLIEQGEMSLLKLWVSKGLNGGQAFRSEEQLSRLPREVVIAAWRHGVALGYSNLRLTAYLLKSGYRPALRWLVWLQDGGAKHLSDRSSNYYYRRDDYKKLLADYTEFPAHSGAAVGDYYSSNWQAIEWDETLQKWSK